MAELRIRPLAKNVIQTVFVLRSLCAESDLAVSRTQLMLTTSQNIASSTPNAPNNDRADYRNECRYTPIRMSVVGSHYKNIDRPQQCGYARSPINCISQTRDHDSLHRARLPSPAIRCSIVKIAQMQEEREPSNELLVKTKPYNFSIVKLLLQFPGWEAWPARAAAKQRAPNCPYLLLRHRHIEQLSTRKTCIAADTAFL